MRIFGAGTQSTNNCRASHIKLSIFLVSVLTIIVLAFPVESHAASTSEKLNGPGDGKTQVLKAQVNSTPTPTSTPEPTQTPRKHKPSRTPRPTATPIPIPPPTDPANLNFIILLGILIVGIVVAGVLINRRQNFHP